MRRPRRDKTLPRRPPAPRIDAKGIEAEGELWDQAFAPTLWRRPAPL